MRWKVRSTPMGADGEMADGQPVDADRQAGPVDVDLAAPAVDAQAQAGLQHHEHRARRPGLRQAGDRIGDRRLAGAAREAAEQLRQAHLELDRGLEHVAQQRRRRRRARRSGPCRRRRARCRAARPSRCGRTSDCSAPRRAASVRMPQPELKPAPSSWSVTRSARSGAGRPVNSRWPGFEVRTRQGWPAPSRAMRVDAQVLDPEALLDRRAQSLGPAAQRRAVVGVAAARGEVGHGPEGGVDVALHLDQRDRARRRSRPSAWKTESSLSFQPWFGEARSRRRAHSRRSPSPSESPSPSIQPIAALERRPQLVDQREVAGARGVGAGQHHEQRRGVDAAVVAAERHLAQAAPSRPCGSRA